MLEWPIVVQIILQAGSLGILGVFLLFVFPKMHEKAVDKIASSQLQAGEMFFKALESERESKVSERNTLSETLKDTAAAIREQSGRLDRLAGQAVCRYQVRGNHNRSGEGER